MAHRDGILQDLILLFLLWGLLIFGWVITWPPSLHQLAGTVCGAAAGLVASVRHNRTWDWAENRRHDSRTFITPSESLGCLIPLASAAGVLTAKFGVVEALLGSAMSEFLMYFVLAGGAFFFAYMGVQDWRYAKRAY
jgi:hypothetical protein